MHRYSIQSIDKSTQSIQIHKSTPHRFVALREAKQLQCGLIARSKVVVVDTASGKYIYTGI